MSNEDVTLSEEDQKFKTVRGPVLATDPKPELNVDVLWFANHLNCSLRYGGASLENTCNSRLIDLVRTNLELVERCLVDQKETQVILSNILTAVLPLFKLAQRQRHPYGVYMSSFPKVDEEQVRAMHLKR